MCTYVAASRPRRFYLRRDQVLLESLGARSVPRSICLIKWNIGRSRSALFAPRWRSSAAQFQQNFPSQWVVLTCLDSPEWRNLTDMPVILQLLRKDKTLSFSLAGLPEPHPRETALCTCNDYYMTTHFFTIYYWDLTRRLIPLTMIFLFTSSRWHRSFPWTLKPHLVNGKQRVLAITALARLVARHLKPECLREQF